MKLGKSAKAFLLVSFLTILALSAFSLVPKSTLGDNTYDFQGISPPSTSHTVYGGSDVNQPPMGPPNPDIGVERPPIGYQRIADSDDDWDRIEDLYSDYHRFKFKILEPIDTITQIYVYHEGYGVSRPEPPEEPGPPGLTLYIWNYMTASWEALDSHSEGGPTDGELQKTITGNIWNYIDSSGYLNLLVQAKENSGSCPFLYVFNGEEYVFAADLYGNGIVDLPYYRPIPEDYAKIEGNLLKTDGATYEMSLAQEYDEISYLDQIALMTVDHSPRVDIFPSLLKTEAGKIYTVSKDLASPVSAIDGDGIDVLQQIARKDGVHTSGRQYELNSIELDLGDLSEAEEIKLVIAGYTRWVPGSGSAEKPVPYERFVQVKDEDGNWVNVYDISEIIAPAAMPRTYVLDLTGKFIAGDYSVRLLSYSDIRLDYVGVDTTPQQDVTVNILSPGYADLHFRGYSSLGGIPATPDYYDLSPDPPLGFSNPTGSFTRFGDVLPLVNERDDKFVIMHHGDEISVDYPYVPAPEGLERDFILYSWGYYKNRYYGTGGTVDPLPFYGMSGYPYPEDESYPYDSEHTAYLREYNTREYSEPAPSTEPEHHTIYTDYVKVVVSTGPPVTPRPYPVGGIVMPADKLAILAPYLALVGLVCVVLTAYIVRRRRA